MAYKTYVDGGKKAIVYHNDHEPCRVYKDGELITDISYVPLIAEGIASVSYKSEYKKNLLDVEIESGELTQKQYKGKNLCDLDYFLSHYTKKSGYSYLQLFVGAGNKITVSIFKALQTGLDFYFNISYESQKGTGNTSWGWIYHNTSSSLCKGYLTFTSTEDYIYLNVSNIDNFKANIGYLQVELGNKSLPYEPFVGCKPSPSPEYPQPIVSCSDNGIDVTVRGTNVFDARDYKSITQSDLHIECIDNVYTVTGSMFSKDNACGILYPIDLKVSGNYRVKAENISGTAVGTFRVLLYVFVEDEYENSSMILSTKQTVGYNLLTFTDEQVSKGIKLGLYVETSSNVTFDNYCVRINVAKGGINTPYEPYFEPYTTHIPVKLYDIDGHKDRLHLNFYDTCVVFNKIKRWSVKEILEANKYHPNGAYCEFESNGVKGIGLNMSGYPAMPGERSYCTHALTTVSDDLYYNLVGTEWQFFNYPQDTAEEFIEWAIANNVTVAYVEAPVDAYTVDWFDFAELKAHTKNQTNIIEVTTGTESAFVTPIVSTKVTYAKWGGNIE